MVCSAFEDSILARGCGKDSVGDLGIVNIICSGTPNLSAQCTCAKLGGLAMIASATNGRDVASSTVIPDASFDIQSPIEASEASTPLPSPASMQERQHPLIISAIPLRRLPTSPLRRVSKPGIRPGFLTIKAINS